jgi:hypothetical protein
MMSVKDVGAIEASYTCCIVRTLVSGRFASTAQTRSRIVFSNGSVPASGLRTTNATDCGTSLVPGCKRLSIRDGQ